MPRKTNQEKVDELQKKIAQLKAKVQQHENRARGEKRRLDTRRKVIVGGWLLAETKEPEELKTFLKKVEAAQEREAQKKVITDWLAELEN